MNKWLSFIGYDISLDIKLRFTYIIAFFSIGLVLMFFIFYVFVVKVLIVNVVTILCLIDLALVIISLKRKKYYLAKFLLIFGFMFQEFSLVFLWFPRDANFNYFFFIVTPITFFIFDMSKTPDKVFLIFSNLLAMVLLILSEILPQYHIVINIDESIKSIFSILSIFSTLVSIFIVYFFYAHTIKTILQELHFLANTDHLTQTYNRRTLFTEGNTLFLLSKKYSRDFAFLLFDIDYFKKINDKYGHPAGDAILVQMSEIIKMNIRKNDLFSRYGGEEFAIIFQNTSLEAIEKTAYKLKNAIEQHNFHTDNAEIINITISVGISFRNDNNDSFEKVVKVADKALYQAKEQGRNRIIILNT